MQLPAFHAAPTQLPVPPKQLPRYSHAAHPPLIGVDSVGGWLGLIVCLSVQIELSNPGIKLQGDGLALKLGPKPQNWSSSSSHDIINMRKSELFLGQTAELIRVILNRK